MRELQECTAEVFRRSEQRIKTRKRNRNHIIALCIPLCLMLTVWSVTVLPAMLPSGPKTAEGESVGDVSDVTLDTAGGSNPDLVHDFVSVEVKGTGVQSQYHSAISDTSGVNAVFEQLYTILLPYASHDDIVGEPSVETESVGPGELKDHTGVTKASSYIITMVTATGEKRTFTLTDHKLYDAELNIAITLTEEQGKGLKSALGLTD